MTTMPGEVVLADDGWEIRSESGEFVPVHADLAYEASGYDQAVLDETRKLCDVLRIRAKTNLEAAIILVELRAGLERARHIKAQRAHNRDMDLSSCRRPDRCSAGMQPARFCICQREETKR